MAHDKEKKRKRSEEDVEKSARKKHASSSTKFGLTRVVHRAVDADAEPVIVSGSGIKVPKKSAFKPYRKRDASNPEMLLHSTTHSRLDYTARENSDGGAAAQKLKHFIAAYDSKENTIEMIPARYLSVRSTVRAEDAATKAEREERDLKGMSNKQALGMEFGTRKAKKAIESLSQNAVSPRKAGGAERETGAASVKSSTGAAAVMDAMATSAAAAPTRDDLQATVDEHKPRPKHNAKATKKGDVYPIDDVIGEQMMINLKVRPWVETIGEGNQIKSESRFVANRVGRLVEKDKITNLKVVKYVGVLLAWFRALKPVKDGGRSLPPRPKMKEAVSEPDTVLEAIKQKFTNGTGQMTKWHVDLLYTHLAVCCLIADEFNTNIGDLAADLRIEMKAIKPYFREVGAVLDKVTEADRARLELKKTDMATDLIARLKLPLEFPKQRIVPQVGRRR